MNMYDIDKLLESTQYKAPEDFTHKVMQKLYWVKSNEISSANRYCRGVGLILIAASLITLLLNITPLMDQLILGTEHELSFSKNTLNYTRTASSLEYITLKIESAIYEPYRLLTDQLIKEESQNEY
jgi:hypothetical protein